MHIGEMIRRTARWYRDDVAIVCGKENATFKEFDEATDRLGSALLRKGLYPGDRVGVLLGNRIELLVAFYALAKAGLVRITLNPRETISEHAYKLADSGAKALLTDQSLELDVDLQVLMDEEEVKEASWTGPAELCHVPRGRDEIYRFAYTGGTTGRPKGVVLTMRNEYSLVANILVDLIPEIGRQDTMLHGGPITHASGAFFLPHFLRGAQNVIMPKFEAESFLDLAEEFGASASFLVPTMLSMILEVPNVEERNTRFRRLVYGGAPAAPALIERGMEVFGPVLAQTYGQAEAPLCITCLKPEEHRERMGSAGRPYTLVEAKVVDEEDRELGPGEVGEIVAGGQFVMREYWNRPEETEEVMRNGWIHTGDVAEVDEEGYFYLRDRKGDMIISGGFNIYPREIEDELLEHSSVIEAAVVGLADERWGERVHAVVATREEVDPEEVLDFVGKRVARYKRPRDLEVWDELPKSGAGKILRRSVLGQIEERGRKKREGA